MTGRCVALVAALLSLGVGQTPDEEALRRAECEGRVRVCWDFDYQPIYEIAVASMDTPCLTVDDPEFVGDPPYTRACARISGTECDRLQDGSGLKVRARNDYGVSPHWSNIAPMLPCACIEVDYDGGITRACEVLCFPGAFDRLPDDEREVGCDNRP